MVKKLQKLSNDRKKGSSELPRTIKDSAQQIWLAGLGAFSKAQEEGGKVFEALVKEGVTLQKKTQGLAEDKISEVTGKVSAMADTVTAKAGQNWDKLEAIFEARTAKAMGKLGVPMAAELQALVARVEALEVENLIEAAQATMVSAAARKECRGAHTVNDYERGADDAEFPLGRNDKEWMKHTLWHSESNSLTYKPVNLQPLTVDSVPPKVRTF